MGGYGSGRKNYWTRTVVEDCSVLSADSLTRDGLLREGVYHSGTLTWRRGGMGEAVSSAGFTVNTAAGSPPTFGLRYTIKRLDFSADYAIALTWTRTPWGARRWWFSCPLSMNGRHCGRRVGRLYLPPGGRYYGCRHCYRLTYTSCNESHRFDAMYAQLALACGMSFAEVKCALTEDAKGERSARRRLKRRGLGKAADVQVAYDWKFGHGTNPCSLMISYDSVGIWLDSTESRMRASS